MNLYLSAGILALLCAPQLPAQDPRPCPGTSFSDTSQGGEAWYGDELARMGAQPLCSRPSEEVYRLLLPSLDALVAVSITRRGNRVSLWAARLVGPQGHEVVDRVVTRDLPLATWTTFTGRLAAAGDWAHPPDPEANLPQLGIVTDQGDSIHVIGFVRSDGSTWVLEAATPTSYRQVAVHSPGEQGWEAAFREVVWSLVELAGMVPERPEPY